MRYLSESGLKKVVSYLMQLIKSRGVATLNDAKAYTYSQTQIDEKDETVLTYANNYADTKAPADHEHPAQTTITGNAGTATALQTARTIALGNQLSGSASFNGSGNVTLPANISLIDLGSNVNLNTVTTAGFYKMSPPYTNGAAPTVSILIVMPISDIKIVQIILATSNVLLQRDYTDSAWSEWMQIYLNAKHLVPKTANAYDVGSSAQPFRTGYIQTAFTIKSDEKEKYIYTEKDEEKGFVPDHKIIDFMMSLNPIGYKFNGDEYLRTHWGLSAQEVEQALYSNGLNTLDFAGLTISPITKEIETGEYVDKTIIVANGEEKSIKSPVMKTVITGEHYGLRYEEFIAPLIKMVQMQQETIKNLKERVVALEQAVTKYNQ